MSHLSFLAALTLVALAATASIVPADGASPIASDPARVCNSLTAEGLPTSTWSIFNDDFKGIVVRNYRCLSEPVPIRGGQHGSFITSINYFAEGRFRDRVETVKLVLNVHDTSTRDAGVKKFTGLVGALFANLDLAPPPALADSMRDGKQATWKQEYGLVRYEVWRSPIERLRLTIEPIAPTAVRP